MSNYSHILVAIDFSSSAEQIINKALETAERNHAKLSILHVVEYLPPIDSAYEPILATNWEIDESLLLEQAKTSLQQFAQKHKLDNPSLHAVIGSPKHEISAFISSQQCDLVILGSHGRHGISLLLGSTANAVLHDMPCDILAVKIAE